jgi:hypothetical protein
MWGLEPVHFFERDCSRFPLPQVDKIDSPHTSTMLLTGMRRHIKRLIMMQFNGASLQPLTALNVLWISLIVDTVLRQT